MAMDSISFARGVPAPECLPEAELADCARTVLERDGKTILSYGTGAGYAPLRELIGDWFKVPPGQVLLTNGCAPGLRAPRAALRPRPDGVRRGPDLRPPAEDPAGERDDRRPDRDGRRRPDPRRARRPRSRRTASPRSSTRSRPSRTRAAARCPTIAGARSSGSRRPRGALILEDDPYGLIRFEGSRRLDLRARARHHDLHLVVLEDDLARAPRRLVHRPGGPRGAADRARQLDLHHAGAAQRGRRSTSSSAAATSSSNLERVNGLLKVRRDAMLAALDAHIAGLTLVAPRGRLLHLARAPRGDEREGGARPRRGSHGRARHRLRRRRRTRSGSPTATSRPKRSKRASSGSQPL